jgi:hypothetical protein
MCMSVNYIATRMMKGLHWSIIQFNYALCACIIVGIILFAECALLYFYADPATPIS